MKICDPRECILVVLQEGGILSVLLVHMFCCNSLRATFVSIGRLVNAFSWQVASYLVSLKQYKNECNDDRVKVRV